MIKYIDSHCHVPAQPYTGAVGAIFNATRPNDWSRVIAACDTALHRWGAIGVHPWYVAGLPADWIANMETELAQNTDLMIGEVGLDSHHPMFRTQVDVFCAQLDLATRLSRTVHVHCVGAWDELMSILKSRGRANLPPCILMHGYSGPADQIARFADKYNAYFSYGDRALNLARGRDRIRHTPLNRLLVESDGDSPMAVIDTVARIAELLSMDIVELADIIYSNTIRMIKHGQITQNKITVG